MIFSPQDRRHSAGKEQRRLDVEEIYGAQSAKSFHRNLHRSEIPAVIGIASGNLRRYRVASLGLDRGFAPNVEVARGGFIPRLAHLFGA